MKKILLVAFIALLILAAACKKVTKTETNLPTPPKAETTGDATVDAVGNDLNNVDSIDKDLSDEQLNDLDSGLTDVQNI